MLNTLIPIPSGPPNKDAANEAPILVAANLPPILEMAERAAGAIVVPVAGFRVAIDAVFAASAAAFLLLPSLMAVE